MRAKVAAILTFIIAIASLGTLCRVPVVAQGIQAAGAGLAGNTFSAGQLGPDGSKTAPSWGFSSTSNAGLYFRTNGPELAAGGVAVMHWDNSGATVGSTGTAPFLKFAPGTIDTTSADASITRSAASTLQVGSGTAGTTTGTIILTNLQTKTVAIASLPTCNSTNEGMRAGVTDANATFTAGIGAVVASGGANHVPVYCDGTSWRIG